MEEQPPNKKIKFSPSNIEQYESEFMHMHNIAMGYEPRPEPGIQQTESITELEMRVFPCPSPMRRTFQDMIAVYSKRYLIVFCHQLGCVSVTSVKFTDLYEETMEVMRDEENQKVCSDTKMGIAVEVLEPLVPASMMRMTPTRLIF